LTSHLLDTDIVIEALRGPSKALRARFSAHEALAVSSVTVAELEFGAHRSRDREANRRAVREFLAFLTVLPFDEEAASHSGDIRAALAAKGSAIGAYDVLIAGHARSLDLVLATGNVREFRRVTDLRVENWRS
jgi:tRNA(fMet)-specific endonuclease VapC